MHGRQVVCGAVMAVVAATAWPGASRPAAKAAGAAVDHRDVVVVGVPPGRAQAIAAAAVAIRRDIEETLFGAPVGRPWAPACTIHVHLDRAAFRRAVAGAPTIARGATSIEFTGQSVSLRRIDVLDAPPADVPPALAHELVHVVLADHFTLAPPPRWADEGLATLFDSPATQDGHEADFRAAADRGLEWRVADLMSLELDPADALRQRVFYGQSASLVRWLLARRDGPTFLRFLDDAAEHGASHAAREHYGFESVEALERAWRAESAAPAASISVPRRRPGSGGAGPRGMSAAADAS